MIIKLSEFLRYSVSNNNKQLTTLQEEIENVNRYLDIEKVRFGKKLNVDQRCDEEALGMKIPALVLQPVIENAVKYGVYESTEPTEIEMICKAQPGMLWISVRNRYDPDAGSKKGAGLGLNNIRNRLMIIYNRDDLIGIKKDDQRFEIQIAIPQNP